MDFDVKAFEKEILEQYNKTLIIDENEDETALMFTKAISGTAARIATIAIAEYHKQINQNQ